MNVQGLITQAIYLSMQDREHQPSVDSGYSETALFYLNLMLDSFRDMIPFAQEFTFNNIDELTNTNFLSVSNVNFVFATGPQPVQAPLKELTLNRWNEIQVVLNLTGVPGYYYFDELAQTIQIYPAPSMPNYEFTVWGRTADTPLTLFEVIPTNLPPFMVLWLIYEVARQLCLQYGRPWGEDKEAERMRLEKMVKGKKVIDLSPRRNIVFPNPNVEQVPPFPYWFYISGGGGGN